MQDDQKAMSQLALASGVCAFFLICELIGGYIANSLAIMTDAAHLFSDITGFLISIMAMVTYPPPPPPPTTV
jgi:Co/Zn/Cd efflux system component